jgi:hypothetical protein
MAGTIAAHTDEKTRDRLRNAAANESRSPSQIVSVALRTVLELSPSARRAIYAIDGTANEEERQFAARLIGRGALKAYERIISARHGNPARPTVTNQVLENEAAIEAEAIELCR